VIDLPRFWNSQPLHTAIMELLEKKRGAITDEELCKALQGSKNDLSVRTLNKTLMKLEINGLIHVFDLTKNKRRIELVKK
jgi:Fe2+ or Zn2+ uptake regulation protein